MNTTFKKAALAIAACGATLSVPAASAPLAHTTPAPSASYGDTTYQQTRDYRYRNYRGNTYGNGYQQQQAYYGEPVYANTQVWQGNDGRYYCRKSNGTTGLLIGGAAGALLGREVMGRYGDRTLGAILGAAGGALLGRQIERNRDTRCR